MLGQLAALIVCIVCITTSSLTVVDANPVDLGGGFGDPVYEKLVETEVVWQKPAKPVGVLFLAHGCSHGATDFWYMSDSCPTCIGLPVEVQIREIALSMGFAVVAISSQEREHSRCWKSLSMFGMDDSETGDLMRVPAILDTLLQREGMDKLPVYAMGPY
eukprot:gene3267-13291_t